LWLSTLITRIWNHCYALWDSRNKDKHGHDTESERAALGQTTNGSHVRTQE
jgi:hypothetical protein